MIPIFPLAPDFCLFATSADTATDGSLSGGIIAMVALVRGKSEEAAD